MSRAKFYIWTLSWEFSCRESDTKAFRPPGGNNLRPKDTKSLPFYAQTLSQSEVRGKFHWRSILHDPKLPRDDVEKAW